MAVVQVPVRDVARMPSASERRRELRPYFAGMSVPELMKDAAMLVEDAVVGMNQPKKFIALEKSVTQFAADRRIIVGQPRRAVRVVIHQHHVTVGNHRG